MKTVLIGALICLNAALLGVLMLDTGSEQAHAQVVGGGTDYMAVTGNIGRDYQALYIIEVGQQRFAALKFDRDRKRLLQLGRDRALTTDFRAGGGL